MEIKIKIPEIKNKKYWFPKKKKKNYSWLKRFSELENGSEELGRM